MENKNKQDKVVNKTQMQQQQAAPFSSKQEAADAFKKEHDVKTAFRAGVSLQNHSNPDMLLNYVDLCARRMFISKGGINVPIHSSDFDIKKYYTTKCIDTVFEGLHTFAVPEPIYVDERNCPIDEEIRKLEIEFVKEALALKAKEDAQAAAAALEAGEATPAPVNDKATDSEVEMKENMEEVDESKRMHMSPPVVSLLDYRPRVYCTPTDQVQTYGVPAEYDEKRSTPAQPVPVHTPSTDPKVPPQFKHIEKSEAEVTDQDKAFLKNQYLATLAEFYKRFVELSNAFEAGCHRGKELVRKMSSRRSRKCFKTNIATNDDGGTLLELIPDSKGDKDFKNVNTWYQEFCNLYHRRQMLFTDILEIIAHCKRYQDSAKWAFVVGEPVFIWTDRIEKYLLSSGNDDLLRFIQKKEDLLDTLTSTKTDGDVFKDALMFHFFNVSPKIIVQMAIAQPAAVEGLNKAVGGEELCE